MATSLQSSQVHIAGASEARWVDAGAEGCCWKGFVGFIGFVGLPRPKP